MSPRATVLGLECLRCRARHDDPLRFGGCPACAAQGVSVNLTVALDLAPLVGLSPERLAAPGRGLWRFRATLPVAAAAPVSLGEGSTPLIPLDRLGGRLGVARLLAKDESQNPTWSYKDRLCAVAVTHAVERGARVLTISSTGNHGASTAAYAARAGLPCVIFTLASVPETMKTLMQAYGAAVVACPTPESRWRLMRQGVERLGWYPTSGYVVPPIGSNPWGIEGYKTLAWEIAEELGWTVPDVVVVPSAYSDGLCGIWKGFTELRALGLVDRVPRMAAAEPLGPLAHALERGLDVPEIVPPGDSVAFSTASRYGTYQGLAALRGSGGAAARITDEGVLEGQRLLAREEGLFVEPSSATALTAAMDLRRRGVIGAGATVVIVLTSGGLKDPGTSRLWLPAVPQASDDLDGVLRVLEESYGLALGP